MGRRHLLLCAHVLCRTRPLREVSLSDPSRKIIRKRDLLAQSCLNQLQTINSVVHLPCEGQVIPRKRGAAKHDTLLLLKGKGITLSTYKYHHSPF